MGLPRIAAARTTTVAIDASVTRMQLLRDATRLVHSRIEGLLPVLEPGLTRARYRRVIEAFYGFHAPLEASLMRAAAGEGAALTLDLRTKLPLLIADLRALGVTTAEIEALPHCRNLPAIHSPSHAIGILYVIEGSTLGGQIIRKHLRAALGIDGSTGTAYFTGYGPETRSMWTGFCDHVNGSSTLEIDAAIDAAADTFQSLARWLEASLGAA